MDAVEFLSDDYAGRNSSKKSSQFNRKLYQQVLIQREKDRIAREKDRELINLLRKTLKDHGIEAPDVPGNDTPVIEESPLLPDGNAKSLADLLKSRKTYRDTKRVTIHFKELGFWKMTPRTTIPTVGSALKKFLLGSGPKVRVNVLRDLTGIQLFLNNP